MTYISKEKKEILNLINKRKKRILDLIEYVNHHYQKNRIDIIDRDEFILDQLQQLEQLDGIKTTEALLIMEENFKKIIEKNNSLNFLKRDKQGSNSPF